jgi:hypothetical protein
MVKLTSPRILKELASKELYTILQNYLADTRNTENKNWKFACSNRLKIVRLYDEARGVAD